MTRSVALAVALVACHAEDPEPTEPTETAPVFEEGDCVVPLEGARCGRVELPERHGSDHDRTISLAVAVLPATGPSPSEEPLVVFNGGPGSDVFGLAGVFSSLNVDRDVVLMSERGTFGAEPVLTCPELAQVDAIFDAPQQDKDAAAFSAMEQCRDRLVAEGVDLSAYNNEQRAMDVPLVLRALGYEGWHLWGVSGGALLVQRLLRDHPDGIRSAMVDSGGFRVPHMSGVLTELVSNTDDRYDRLFAECAADPTCSAQYPTFESDLLALVAALEQSPRPTEITHPVTGETRTVQLDGDLLLQLYTNSMSQVHLLPLVTALATYGDFAILESVLPGAFVSYEGETFADGLYHSVFCADAAEIELGSVSTDARPELLHALMPAVEHLLEVCAMWDVPAQPAGEPVSSDTVPILIMEGLFDTNRDPEQGREVASQFSTAYLAEFADRGHVVLGDCALSMMGQFMADPSVSPDLSCVPGAVPWQ